MFSRWTTWKKPRRILCFGNLRSRQSHRGTRHGGLESQLYHRPCSLAHKGMACYPNIPQDFIDVLLMLYGVLSVFFNDISSRFIMFYDVLSFSLSFLSFFPMRIRQKDPGGSRRAAVAEAWSTWMAHRMQCCSAAFATTNNGNRIIQIIYV